MTRLLLTRLWSWQKGAFDGPAHFQTSLNPIRFDSEFSSPIGHALCPPVERKQSRSGVVSQLQSGTSPSTVVRRVWAVVVNAINRHTGWTRTHISKKVCEAVFPPLADGDSSRAVSYESITSRVEAPRFHVSPDPILASWKDCASSACAAARGLTDPHQISGRHHYYSSAIATALPNHVVVVVALISRANCGEQPESSSSQVSRFRLGYSLVSHAVSSFVGKGVVRGWRTFTAFVNPVINYPTQIEAVFA